MKHALKITTNGLLWLALLPLARTAAAQGVNAAPKLDLDRYMGTWYEIARYPVKAQKRCVGDAMELWALGDKRDSFQVVVTCSIKDGNSDSWNFRGKLDKSGDGRLKVSRLLIFSVKYWVVATGPADEWALLGTPNHKSLWVLSRTPTLEPGVLAAVEAKAAAEGFDTAKLVTMPQHP